MLLLPFIFVGCADELSDSPVSETRLLLDTYCTITIYGRNASSLLDEAFKLVAEFDAMFSITNEGSDVWRINHGGGAPVTVSPHTADLIRLGIYYADISDGKFDISIGRLSRLWVFSGTSGVPPADEIAFARDTVDFRNIVVADNVVQLTNPDAWVDLGGIAKGYIADRLADFLRERGVVGAVIDLGGDVAIVGAKPEGSPWRVGVRHPAGGREDLIGAVEAGEGAIVSSGIYERTFEENGVLYHHILDPETGMPARSNVVSATVVADTGVVGEALSTIILLIGSEEAADIVWQLPGFVGALLVLENGDLLRIGNIDFQSFN